MPPPLPHYPPPPLPLSCCTLGTQVSNLILHNRIMLKNNIVGRKRTRRSQKIRKKTASFEASRSRIAIIKFPFFPSRFYTCTVVPCSIVQKTYQLLLGLFYYKDFYRSRIEICCCIRGGICLKGQLREFVVWSFHSLCVWIERIQKCFNLASRQGAIFLNWLCKRMHQTCFCSSPTAHSAFFRNYIRYIKKLIDT